MFQRVVAFLLCALAILLTLLPIVVQGRCDTTTPCVINQQGRRSSDCPSQYPVCDGCLLGSFCGKCSYDEACGKGFRCSAGKCVVASKYYTPPQQHASSSSFSSYIKDFCSIVNCSNPFFALITFLFELCVDFALNYRSRLSAYLTRIASNELLNVSLGFIFFGAEMTYLAKRLRLFTSIPSTRFHVVFGIIVPSIVASIYISLGYGQDLLPKLGSKLFFCVWLNCQNPAIDVWAIAFESFEFYFYAAACATLGVIFASKSLNDKNQRALDVNIFFIAAYAFNDTHFLVSLLVGSLMAFPAFIVYFIIERILQFVLALMNVRWDPWELFVDSIYGLVYISLCGVCNEPVTGYIKRNHGYY